jgi:hypothetical protein
MGRFDDLFNEADAAFNANEKYKEELKGLAGLSEEQITSVSPDTKAYDALVKVVKQASKENLSKAQLVDNIKSLGDIAVKLAKKIPQFGELL